MSDKARAENVIQNLSALRSKIAQCTCGMVNAARKFPQYRKQLAILQPQQELIRKLHLKSNQNLFS